MDELVTPLDIHEDRRGWVSEIYSGELGENLRNIHLGTMKPGAIRGNHRHRKGREWIVFFDGPVEFRWQDEDTVREQTIEGPSEIQLQPGIGHGFRNPEDSTKTISFAAYRDQAYDEANPDVEPVQLFEAEESIRTVQDSGGDTPLSNQ